MTIPDFVARLQTEVLRANRPGKKHRLDGILTERLRRTAKHEESYVGADSDAKKAEFLRSPTMSATPLPPGKDERCQGPEMSTQWRPPTSQTRRQEKPEIDNPCDTNELHEASPCLQTACSAELRSRRAPEPNATDVARLNNLSAHGRHDREIVVPYAVITNSTGDKLKTHWPHANPGPTASNMRPERVTIATDRNLPHWLDSQVSLSSST